MMMTITQAERLVRRITEVLSQPNLESQAAKLAQDYAELARAATRRLEQCSVMIEAGEELQALQLAETRPPLLDLITILSFRQASEWRTYCQTHSLPWVEPFYDKFVRMLNATYGKGIASDHPFYKDYRRAVMKGDETRALSILRVIARLNPADKNTVDELQRLEGKTLRLRLEDLQKVVESGDAVKVIEALEQLEGAALPIPPSHPIWQQAQVVRCQYLLRQIQVLHERDAWEEAEGTVERIRALATENTVPLPQADVEVWNVLEAWTTERRAARTQELDFQRALEALEYQVTATESKRASGRRQPALELHHDFNALAGKWQDLERFGRPLDESLLSRSQQICSWLQKSIKNRQRSKRLLTMVSVTLLLVVLAVAAVLFWGFTLERELLTRFARLISGRRVAETQALLGQIPALLRARASLAAAAVEARGFVAREMELKRAFDETLGVLTAQERRGFTNALAEIQTQRILCDEAASRVAPEFQSGCESSLQAFDRFWTNYLEKLRPARNADFLSRLETPALAADRLDPTNGVAALREALARAQGPLLELEVIQRQPVALDEALLRRFYQLTNRVAGLSNAANQWEQLRAETPSSLEGHLDRLKRWAESPFATAAEREAVTRIRRLDVSQRALAGALLWPNHREAWDLLTNTPIPELRLRPDEPSPQEKEAFLKLRDDPNIQEVYFYKLTKNPRPGNLAETHPVFSRKRMGKDRTGANAGMLYDPMRYPATLRFEQQSVDDWDYSKVEKGDRTVESESFKRLGFPDLIDPNTGAYQKSVLELLDRLNQDKDSSAIFRAYLELKLFALAAARPMAWGMHWSPSAQNLWQTLRGLGAQNLQSGDWLVPAQVALYEKPLRRCFEQARSLSLEQEARFFHKLMSSTLNAGFAFAGHADARGIPVLTQTETAGGEYWGWSLRSGAPALLLRRAEDGGSAARVETVEDPLGFTPLFAFRGDRRQILRDASVITSYSLRGAGPLLPPFFAGAYE